MITKRRWVSAAAVLTLSLGLFVAAGSTSASAVTPTRDGSTSELAAPSCWAIKQQNPAATDGVYWLQTATLIAPEQFYCDMTTDGGGWVLVGRGRENWTWSDAGQGNVATMLSTPSGVNAFSPVALPTKTINGLLDGTRMDALPDGVRIVRSTNAAGTTTQDLRYALTNRANWSWAIGGGEQINKVSIVGGNTYNVTSSTQLWSADTSYQSLLSYELQNHNYEKGFGFGSKIVGTNSPTSYLWSYKTEGNANPFTQVWIRPKLTSTSYPAIGASGTPASTLQPLMSSITTPMPWGVTGVVGGGTGEFNIEVEAMTVIGRTMYVGGKFANVQQGAGGTPISQPYLAAFNVDTGNWVSSFRPLLDGEIWDLQAMPDGNLLVGGEFTHVNGAAMSALAELNPTDGSTVSTWKSQVTYVNNTGLAAQVKAIDVQGPYAYLGGRFNRIYNGTTAITDSHVARVRVTDGVPDGAWKPQLDGTVVDLDASSRGDRVYLVGYFQHVQGNASPNEAAVSTATGAAFVTGLAPWVPSIGSTARYQQAIREYGNDVWQGGSEHILGDYNRDNYSLQHSVITRNGGDFQALAEIDGVVYAGCHCGNYVYSESHNWSNPIPNSSDVHNVKYIVAMDEATGQPLYDFWPGALDTRAGNGAWELTADPNGCLWFGGDFTRGSFTNGAYQWLGGFGKFCPRDTTAPTTPTNLQTAAAAGGVNVSWSAASDNSGVAPHYEVLRDDRVIATTTSTSYTDSTATLPATYYVRAIDGSGNRSASTAGSTVQAPDTTPPTAPTGLQTTSVTSSAVGLSWTAATDDRGVTGYQIVRDGQVVATSTGTTASDDGVAPSTTYSYVVRAVDAAGNVSPPSNPVSATTPAGVFSDSFTAADGSPWSGSWTTSAGSGSVTTQGNAGALAFTDVSGAYARAQLTGPAAQADGSVLLSYTFNSATAISFFSATMRGSGGWANTYRPKNGYSVQIQSNLARVLLLSTVNGTTTTIAAVAGANAVGTATQRLRFRVVGSTVQFKIWTAGQPEPSAWTSTVTDSSVTAPGQLFLSHSRGAADVGAKTVSVDDVSLSAN